jgi:23S rRNA pseudouridine1911/1915/1917 synthase
MKLDIIFENDFLIAINKPAGLLSIPDRDGKEISLKKILQEKYGNIFTVHRLDKATSGVIVFAKDEATHAGQSQLFESRETEKIYYGLVHGSVSPQN